MLIEKKVNVRTTRTFETLKQDIRTSLWITGKAIQHQVVLVNTLSIVLKERNKNTAKIPQIGKKHWKNNRLRPTSATLMRINPY